MTRIANRLVVIVILGGLSAPSRALGSPGSVESSAATHLTTALTTTPSQGSAAAKAMLKISGYLVIMVAGLFGVLAIVKRRPGLGRLRSGRRMTLIDTLRVGTRQGVHLLKVDSRVILIGVTEHQISLLAGYSDDVQLKSEGDMPERVLVNGGNGEMRSNDGTAPSRDMEFSKILRRKNN